MSVKVSVIIPAYNTEEYMAQCLDSLLKQTLKEIEIVIVDDGSTDTTLSILKQYEEQYPEKIRVFHKENGGQGSARNLALKYVRGEYLGFVDSDDDVELDMYEKLYNKATQYDVDFIVSDYIRINSNTIKCMNTLNIKEGYYSKEDIKSLIYPSLIIGNDLEYGPLLSVCPCLFRKTFLYQIPLEFDEEVRWSEDNIFSAIMGYNANSFYYLKNEGLYHYYQNPGTITTGYRKGAWEVYSTMNDHLHDYFDKVNDYDFSKQLDHHLMFYACNCLGMIASKLDKKEALSEINNILKDYKLHKAFNSINSLNVNIKLKIQLYLMKFKLSSLLISIIKRR